MPTRADAITREHLEHFFAHEQSRPHQRLLGGEIKKMVSAVTVAGAYPFSRMKPPTVPEQPVPVLTEEQLKALLAACKAAASTSGATPR